MGNLSGKRKAPQSSQAYVNDPNAEEAHLGRRILLCNIYRKKGQERRTRLMTVEKGKRGMQRGVPRSLLEQPQDGTCVVSTKASLVVHRSVFGLFPHQSENPDATRLRTSHLFCHRI